MSTRIVFVCDICKEEAEQPQGGGVLPEGWQPATMRGSLIEHACKKCHQRFIEWVQNAGTATYATYRDALERISHALKMPGAPDLIHDVPKEVERRLGELAQVADWTGGDVDPINVPCPKCKANVAQFCLVDGIRGHLVPPDYHSERVNKAKEIGLGVPLTGGPYSFKGNG